MRPAPAPGRPFCRTAWCGRRPHCCSAIPTPGRCAVGDGRRTAGQHERSGPEALRATSPRCVKSTIAAPPSSTCHLRPEPAHHHVPDVLDCRRYPQPRCTDARVRQRLPGRRRTCRRKTKRLTISRWCSEFAATVDPGRAATAPSSTGCPSTCSTAGWSCGSPYADAIWCRVYDAAGPTDQEVQRVCRLAEDGPPAEAVGLQPFTLTVPPRRTEGSADGSGLLGCDPLRDTGPSPSAPGGATATTSSAGPPGPRSSTSRGCWWIASPMFHFGILVAIVGHVIGLVILGESRTHAPGSASTPTTCRRSSSAARRAGRSTLTGIGPLIYRRRAPPARCSRPPPSTTR